MAMAQAPRVHGLVLAVTPKDGQAIVRHEAFGAMPAMTMSFRIVPRTELATIQPGSTIDARVDTSTEPWSLRDVKVGPVRSVTDGDPLERMTPLQVGDVVPDVPFYDQSSRPFRISDLRGRDVLLAFIYTHSAGTRACAR